MFSFLGLIVAVSAIAFGYALEGEVATALFNGPALVIVLGGTLGAVMLQTPGSVFAKTLKISHWVFFFLHIMISTPPLNK